MTQKDQDIEFLRNAIQESFYNGDLSFDDVIKNHAELNKVEKSRNQTRRKIFSENFIYWGIFVLSILAFAVLVLFCFHLITVAQAIFLEGLFDALLVAFGWCLKSIVNHYHQSKNKAPVFKNDEPAQPNES